MFHCHQFCSCCRSLLAGVMALHLVFLRNSSGALTRALPKSLGTVRFLAEPAAKATQAPATNTNLLKTLPFNTYMQAKKRVRNIAYITAIPFLPLGVIGTSIAMAELYPDLLNPQNQDVPTFWGIDPMFVMSAAVFVSALASYMVGVTAVRSVWRLFNSQTAAAMKAREEDFLRRVAKHRTVGNRQSDDYYGDKVKSIADYRQWLRDQKKAAKTALPQE
eukprot:m.235997 g.235997  ORF g.235997 m.235997 type:complete len:219 (+) comp20387_c0_seq1:96-752(+)